MVRGESIMFYIYFDPESKHILGITNELNNSNQNYVTKSYEDVGKFLTGELNFNEYKLQEDVRVKGTFSIVPIDYEPPTDYKHPYVTIRKTLDYQDDSIQFLKNNSNFVVNNFLDKETCKELISGTDYIKEYYIVKSSNRFILLDSFQINLKEFALQKQLVISTNIITEDFCILTHNSHIEHTYNGEVVHYEQY